MLQRLYVHNFRCLENFELVTGDATSLLLIGRNGMGKSTVRDVLIIFQSIARGTNRVSTLITELDSAHGRTSIPMRFSIELKLEQKLYSYEIALELPSGFQEYRVLEEKLTAGNIVVFHRNHASVVLPRTATDQPERSSQFAIDWHLFALPLIHTKSADDPVAIVKSWLSRMVLLAPIPPFMTGLSSGETMEPALDGSNIADWFNGVMSPRLSIYSTFESNLKLLIPDFVDVINETVGIEIKRLSLRFNRGADTLMVHFDRLSDGERCLFLIALIITANKAHGPLFCFWDVPDNYLSLTDIGQLMLELRREFVHAGQILVTSHHPETIRMFTDESTLFLDRRSHLEPTQIRLLSDMPQSGDLINAIITGDIYDGDQ
ncbi:MAG: AAA family ATPase [Bacteroidia bacterium]|nr:AAA family ATPase [Bacteroidia bacterium]